MKKEKKSNMINLNEEKYENINNNNKNEVVLDFILNQKVRNLKKKEKQKNIGKESNQETFNFL